MRGAEINDVRRAIEASHAAYIEAMKRGNVDEVAAHFTHDAILLPQAADALRGRAAIRAWLASWLPTTTFHEFSVTTQDVDVVGTTAYEVGTFHQVWARGDTAPVPYRGTYLMVWRREEDGRWRVLRDMFSAQRSASTST